MTDNPFKKMVSARKAEPIEPSQPTEPTEAPPPKEPKKPATPKRGRGRPPGGKRSDPGWIGRTYYVKEQTDIDSEVELAMLRSQGIEMDKSELVNALMGAWVRYRRGEKINLSEISPRRKS